MARARSIKPGFFLNESLASLHPLTRILFEGLWCHADREGRLEDRPRRIKAEVLPYDDHDVDEGLNDLQRCEFILRYRNCKSSYIQIVNFTRHQNPHVKEPASTIQAPDEPGASTVQAPDEHRSDPALTLNPIPLTLERNPGANTGQAPGKHRASMVSPSSPNIPDTPGLNRAAFAEWDAERRGRPGKSKARWTTIAQTKAANLLAKHSEEEQQAMVDAAIGGGWDGLHSQTSATHKQKPKHKDDGSWPGLGVYK